MARSQDDQAAAEAEQDQRLSDLESQQAPAAPAAPAPAPAAGSATIDQLKQLSDLHQQGVLTDAEFAAAKAKLLGT